MWPGVFALFGILLLVLAAFGVTAGRASLVLSYLTAIGG